MILRRTPHHWLTGDGLSVPAAVAGAATILSRWAAKHGASTITTITLTPEAPMTLSDLLLTETDDALIAPNGDKVPAAILDNLRALAQTWATLPPATRAAMGQIRLNLHVNGAAVLDHPQDRTLPQRTMPAAVMVLGE